MSWICDGVPKNGKQYPNAKPHEPHENLGPDCEICGLPKEAMEASTVKKKSTLQPAVLVAGLLAAFIGGGFAVSRIMFPNDSPSISKGKLTILGDTFSGYSTFRNSAFQEALKEKEINLNYQDEFDQTKRAELLNQGKADILVTTLDQFIKQQPQGKIVGLIDRTVGADAVILNTKKYPNLKSLLDLSKLVQQSKSQGQQLGITFAGDTPSEYLALVLNAKFEAFNLSDFKINQVDDASEAWKLLQDAQQNVAVAVIWEPYVTQARKQGYTVVLSSQDAPEVIIDIIVASDSLISSQSDKIANFLLAYYSHIDARTIDISKLQSQIAEDGELSPADAATVLQGINFFTSIEANKWLTDGTLSQRIGSTAAVLALTGRISQIPQNPQDLYSSELITKAAENTQNLISLLSKENPELVAKLVSQKEVVSQKNTTNLKNNPDIGNLKVEGEIKFATGSSNITEEGKSTLNRLVKKISEFNDQTVAVRIIGHTSQTGTLDFNQTLSQQRAQVVVDYLSNRNLKHKIEAEGKGFSEPLSSIPPSDIRNQRTEIRMVRLN